MSLPEHALLCKQFILFINPSFLVNPVRVFIIIMKRVTNGVATTGLQGEFTVE